MTLPLGIDPRVIHRLAVALRFEDAFTRNPVDMALDVRAEVLPTVIGMPRLPWRARRAADFTYRFSVSQNTVMPVGAIAVTVTAPGEQYENYEPISIVLPRPLAGPLPTRQDYLVRLPLWPTRRLGLSPGETAISGQILNAAGLAMPGYRVQIAEAPGPVAPATQHTYTDARGGFLVRLPGLRMIVGAPPVAASRLTVQLAIAIQDPLAAVVAPVTPVFPVTVPLGRITTLLITVP